MRKRKNGDRRYWHWVKRGLLILIVGLIFILSTPTIYAVLSYYHVPETELGSGNWLVGFAPPDENKICIATYIGGGYLLMPEVLKYKMVIDGQVVPYHEIQRIEIPGQDWMDGTFPAIDYVCTVQPNLEVGEHELIFFEYLGGHFEWTPYKRSIFIVDENGNVTDDFIW